MKIRHCITKANHSTRSAVCSHCGVVKITKPDPRGYARCMNKRNQTSRIGKFRRKYGIDVTATPVPLSCELCEGSQRIAYDHDHKTGRFRGWLCMRCNTALGLVDDDVEILKKLIGYLER